MLGQSQIPRGLEQTMIEMFLFNPESIRGVEVLVNTGEYYNTEELNSFLEEIRSVGVRVKLIRGAGCPYIKRVGVDNITIYNIPEEFQLEPLAYLLEIKPSLKESLSLEVYHFVTNKCPYTPELTKSLIKLALEKGFNLYIINPMYCERFLNMFEVRVTPFTVFKAKSGKTFETYDLLSEEEILNVIKMMTSTGGQKDEE